MPPSQQDKWDRVLQTVGRGMGWTCHELEPLDTWVQEAAEQVQRMNDEARKEQKHSWAKFLQQAAQGQAGLLHKLSKPVVRWAPRPSLEHHGDTQDPQVAVVAVVEEWAKEWRVDSVLQLQQRPWETCQVEPMEPITAEEFGKLAATSRNTLAWGLTCSTRNFSARSQGQEPRRWLTCSTELKRRDNGQRTSRC